MDVDLLFDPLAPPRYCPQCARVGIKTAVKKFKVNPHSADMVIMCKNEKCPWPFSVRSPTEATVRLELPVLKKIDLQEISKSKKNPAWLKSMTLNAGPVVLLQGDNPDCQLSFPVLLLVAISPLVKSILSAYPLPPTFSTPVISIPSLSVDILESVGEMLVSGMASMDVSRLCGVREVFKMMGIEDRMVIHSDSVDTVGDDIHGDMKVDYLYVSEQSLRDDQTEGVVHDHKSTDIEDTNGNVFVDNLDVLKNLVSIKSEECLRDNSGQIDFENANIEIVVKLEDQLKFEDSVFRVNQDEQSRQIEEKDINLTSQEESVTTIKTVAKHIQVRIPRLKHADSQDECFADMYVEDAQLLKQPSSHTSLKKCPHCDKKMNSKHLSKHIRIVHNKETVQCPYCDKTLGYFSLKRHISYIHKQKKCPHCEKKMIAGKLSTHIRIVHKKKTVQCPQCDKTLGCSSLKKHTSSIHKQNPLPQKKCPLCETMMIAGHISTHIRIVHNKETAQCPHCDKRIAGYGLSKHISQVHNKKK